MKIMLDTQVFIWLINDDSRLGAESLKIIKDPSNALYISYFSFFEMAIKASIGKLIYQSSLLDDLPKMGVELILPDTTELKGYRIFNSNNKDPFDNMLISTALDKKFILMTSDNKILDPEVNELKLLDAAK